MRTISMICISLMMMQPAWIHASGGCRTYRVRVDTAERHGVRAHIRFELTSSDIPYNAYRSDCVRILNFGTDGELGPYTDSWGGPIVPTQGRTPKTPEIWIWSSHFANGEGKTFKSLGDWIVFDVQMFDLAESSAHPSQFAVYLSPDDPEACDYDLSPLVETSDPLGANALFTITTTGDSCEVVEVFHPGTFAEPDSILLILSP